MAGQCPLLTRLLVKSVGLSGLLLVAAAGFAMVIVLVHLLMREKRRLREASPEAQQSTLDHALPGNALEGFGQLLTSRYILNPVLMVIAFLVTALSPTLFMIQTLQVVRRIAQYAIARPSREICFTVVEQTGRYKAKNVIDTVVYRCGDVSSAWVQAGLRSMGYGLNGTLAVEIGASLAWFAVAALLGARYEKIRAQNPASTAVDTPVDGPAAIGDRNFVPLSNLGNQRA